MSTTEGLTPETILDAINEGVYVTDATRRIVYWGKAAERILGWRAGLDRPSAAARGAGHKLVDVPPTLSKLVKECEKAVRFAARGIYNGG